MFLRVAKTLLTSVIYDFKMQLLAIWSNRSITKVFAFPD
jgi:hypothetical protein